MLQQLILRINKESNKSSKIDIDFIIKNDLIYHISNIKRLCISFACEKIFFELTHNQNNHANFYRIYQQLNSSVYISRFSKKISPIHQALLGVRIESDKKTRIV